MIDMTFDVSANRKPISIDTFNAVDVIASAIFDNAFEHGFHDEDSPKEFGTWIALAHGELSEALEAHRKNKSADKDSVEALRTGEYMKDTFDDVFRDGIKDSCEDELADAFIRILDMAKLFHIDLATHVALKMQYNKNRPFRHTKKY